MARLFQVTTKLLLVISLLLLSEELPSKVAGSKFRTHVKLGVDSFTYIYSRWYCVYVLEGTLIGQSCNSITPCSWPGAVCPKNGLPLTLCCCPKNQCCDPNAKCPGCTKSPCRDQVDPCKDEVCLRYPDAQCTPRRCGECKAYFSTLLPVGGNSTDMVMTDVTDICHLVECPSKDPPTGSGDIPPGEDTNTTNVSPDPTTAVPTATVGI